MAARKLPPEDHIIRNAPYGKLLKDDDDNVIGVLWSAFERREKEKTLSATWLEYFAGTKKEQINQAVWTIRDSALDIKPKSAFAIGNVLRIIDACASMNQKVRILHEAENDNPAHAAVRSLPRDNIELLELLAADAWSEYVLNSEINAKPEGFAPPERSTFS